MQRVVLPHRCTAGWVALLVICSSCLSTAATPPQKQQQKGARYVSTNIVEAFVCERVLVLVGRSMAA